MSCNEKQKMEMYSVEHCIWVLYIEQPKKSDLHTLDTSVKCIL